MQITGSRGLSARALITVLAALLLLLETTPKAYAIQDSPPAPPPFPPSPPLSPAAAALASIKAAWTFNTSTSRCNNSLATWIGLGDPCNSSWTGITCSGGNVTAISFSLPSPRLPCLYGSLPDAMSSLTALSSLTIRNSYINGTLPTSWSSMAVLTHLDLSGNSFTGKCPTLVALMSLSSQTFFCFSATSLTLVIAYSLRSVA